VPGVSNSSPLIHLAFLGDLDLLPQLFGHIFIPEAVHNEVVIAGKGKSGAEAVAAARGHWLIVERVTDRGRV
jgi:predicted nucleic acid-binding protein